jgi:hypothetical protein
MGELCLRWAMKLPADVPIKWPDNATFSMYQIREALLSLDDDTDLPRLSVRFLSARTGLALSTVRTTLKRMEKLISCLSAGGSARALPPSSAPTTRQAVLSKQLRS